MEDFGGFLRKLEDEEAEGGNAGGKNKAKEYVSVGNLLKCASPKGSIIVTSQDPNHRRIDAKKGHLPL